VHIYSIGRWTMMFPAIVRERVAQDHRSIEERILEVLCERGAHMVDQLGGVLPDIGGAQLLLAIDRLSRTGAVAIGSPKNGDYLVWALPGRSAFYVAF